MGVLKLPGLASGLDTDGLIKTLMAFEKRPVTAMQTKSDKMTSEANAWRDLNTRMLTLQKRIEELNALTSADWTAKKATVSDTAMMTVTQSQATAAIGTYTVEVQTLATATSWQSGVMIDTATGNPKPISDANADLNLSGKIKVTWGPKSGATFTINATDSLNDIVKTINDNSSSLGFTASVAQVNPGDYRLVVKGLNGAANDFALEDDTGSTAGAELMITSTTPTITMLSTAANGTMKVNGSTVTFADNVVRDAVGGVSLSLLKTGTTTVTVAKDQSKVIDAVKKVVDQYNQVVDFINQQTSYDSKTKKAGTLLGEQRINDIRDGIRRVLVDPVRGQPAAQQSLSVVGITTEAFKAGSATSGKLTFDQEKFVKALDENPDALRNMFNTTADPLAPGVAVRAKAYLDNYTKAGGILDGQAKAINKGVSLLKERITRYEEQILPMREQRLRSQFLNLEKAMSTFQGQGNWLSAQIKGLSSSGN